MKIPWVSFINQRRSASIGGFSECFSGQYGEIPGARGVELANEDVARRDDPEGSRPDDKAGEKS